MKYRRPILALFVLLSLTTTVLALPEPGPENGGLRLRLVASPRSEGGEDGYDVRLDLFNTSERAITLRTGWRHDDKGDVRDYIEAATSIECVPAVAPWNGGVPEGRRTSPQPEEVLKAGEVLSVRWRTEGRHLKNRVTNPNEVQNPEFPFPGLYSVHAILDVITSERTVRLRSNEQLVSVGESRAMPKYTLGQLWSVEGEEETAMLGLGSLHKIELGDEFLILTGKREAWKLTVARAEPTWCQGSLEPMLQIGPNPAAPKPRFPERGSNASLIVPK